MKYYKWSVMVAIPITIMALIIALLVNEKDPFVMNLCISIFASGLLVYTIEMFKNDIREFASFIDHYADTNEPFVCHLNKVAEELRRMISTKDKKTETK